MDAALGFLCPGGVSPSRTSAFAGRSLTAQCTARPRAFARRPSAKPRMVVVDVGSTDEMDKVLDSAGDTLVVIDYSTTWCGPCKIIAPLFEEMSERHDDVIFVKVMGDETPEAGELMKREGIRAVPAFHFYKEKTRLRQFTGAKSTAIEDAIKEYK